MAIYLSAALRQRLEAADDHQFAYFQTLQANSGSPMVVDHVVPRSKRGVTDFENLSFSCYRCNLFKGAQTEAVDPLSGDTVPLYHPHRHLWAEHFSWDDAGLRILGLTAIGRATINALNMNNAVITDARRNWVRLGWPPRSR